MPSVSRFCLMALCAALPAAAQESSLAETARREQERREEARRKPGAASPVITEETLARATAGRGTLSTSGSQSAAEPALAPPPASPSGSEGDSIATSEKHWRTRFAAAREHLKAAEAASWVEVVEPVLVGGGGIGGLTTGRAVYVQMKVRKQIETEALRQARRALVDLEEELRKSGGLPGWARE